MLLFVARIGSWGRGAGSESRMTKSHGRKSRARNTSRTRGAAFASANAGTLHQHSSGPSAADLQPADPKRWGIDTAPDMRTASALIGACMERCAPCQQLLADKLLDEAAVVLAVLAGSVYTLHAESEADAGAQASRATQAFFGLVKQAREYRDPGHLPPVVEMLPREHRAELLEDTLDLWTYYGHVDAALLRERYPSPNGLSTVTVTVEGSDPQTGPGVVVDLSALAHPAAYSVRTDMTRTGSGLVPSVALVPESPEAGYDDLRWRCGWEPYIFQGLPSVDPAWVLKIDRTGGALLGVVRLLDATLLPERQPWEWRQNVYDRILWRAPVPAPVSASAEWLEAARRQDTVLLYGPLDAGAVTPAEWEAGAATPPDWERLVSVHAYCRFTDRM
ncbi:hypothetical protein AQJ54_40080 [Streptomyces griseorubiginosus]|uniref:Uncharacterized protein n=2 Tax=Streptomyces griseorubiginosus TaxID=67304 RepID=A0A101RP58_9ACTN|nr:hypothetical protein AQJ54_40080 [Streptomyces griseorubiginosus]